MCEASTLELLWLHDLHDMSGVWDRAFVHVPVTDQPHRLVIKTIHGDAANGVVAIDDIQYMPCI